MRHFEDAIEEPGEPRRRQRRLRAHDVAVSQRKLRDEVAGLGLSAEEPMTFDRLEEMPLAEMAFKEALRSKPRVTRPRLTRSSPVAADQFDQAKWIV